jgi:hypothetical protein
MKVQSFTQLISDLQTAIGPVILISGVGLLLLAMTNRLGQITNRLRSLSNEVQSATGSTPDQIREQLVILWRRARFLRAAITLACMSVLCVAIMIIVLFLSSLLNFEATWLISALFIACMACLIGSMAFFVHDVNRALAALKLELIRDGIKDV